MQIPSQSDFDRRVFAAYILTAVAVLVVIIRVDLFANFSSTVGQTSQGLGAVGYSWIDKLTYVTRGAEFLGLTLLGAAYLLMLDSDEEPKAMKVAIFITAFLGLLLAVAAVMCVADVLLSHSVFLAVSHSSKLQAISDFLAAGVLGFAVLALTWPFISDQSRSGPATSPDADVVDGDVESGQE